MGRAPGTDNRVPRRVINLHFLRVVSKPSRRLLTAHRMRSALGWLSGARLLSVLHLLLPVGPMAGPAA